MLEGPSERAAPQMNRKQIVADIELPEEFQAKRVSRDQLN